MEYPSPTTLAIPFFLAAVVWEWTGVARRKLAGRYDRRDALASMTMGIGNALIGAATAGAALAMMDVIRPYRIMTIEPTAATGVILFVTYDFLYYWKHRAMHRIRWFWCEHVTHHSSQLYNLTTALRQPWFGPFSGLIVFGWPAVWMGFDPRFIAFVAGINLVYQFWIHTETVGRLPRWAEALMNTPSHHRVHHAVNPRYLDANYGGVFIIWDRLFGTFVREEDEDPPQYGIVRQLNSFNPGVIAFHELAALLRDMRKDGLRPGTWIGRALHPPGWSPDGRHQRSEDIRRAWRSAGSASADDVPD
jgi:sterol desaturase/sphingolipid hydroxylase (fatty acid hydroxylase superfamily)